MEPPTTPWHALSPAETLARLEATEDAGLSQAEAAARLARHGPNRLAPPPRPSLFRRFLLQFHNALIYVLLGSAVVTAALAHWVDTGVILGVVLINALIGVIQEGRAERALDAIRDMLAPHAAVRRDGERADVDAAALVPGDIVLLRSGDKVPADLRLLHTTGLLIQEAVLTGEAEPVAKAPDPVAAEAALADRSCLAHAGTLVAAGTATGVVIATATATEIGRISALLSAVVPLTTPLLRQMDDFARRVTLVTLALSAATFAIGMGLQGYGATEMFLAAVGLAVAAIPEGLPAILTITLAIGVARMARRHAIIRQLPAVETLGSVSVICTDKTGTLTRNEMTVQAVATADRLYQVTGSGYDPEGEFRHDGAVAAAEADPALWQVLTAAVLCNDAELHPAEGGWRMQGNPTDGALLVAARKAGIEAHSLRTAQPRRGLLPFESAHKFMATRHRGTDGTEHVIVKGAPERVIAMCAAQRHGDHDAPLDADTWQRRIDALAAEALRVLAVAERRAPAGSGTDVGSGELAAADLDHGLTLLGLFGLIDPPRPEAITAIATCRAAGIRVKMITGDHAATAAAIAERLGLDTAPGVLRGPELDALDDAALCRRAPAVDVYARTTPEHKLRLVTALQEAGQVVAMTGDGVNDAPALKRADIGVAMGRNGTEAAKEAAGMVLADDNFASIAAAVEEGRTVYDNLKKTILFALPVNFGQAAAVLAAVLAGMTMPIIPVQILWINMVTAVTLGLALAFEPAEPGVMARPPRRAGEPILSRFVVWRVALVSALLVAGAFGLFAWHRSAGASEELARTVAVNALVAGEIAYLINSRRSVAASWNWDGVFGSRPVLLSIALMVGLQAGFTYLPPMQALFRTAPLPAADWLMIFGVAVAVFVLVEGEKALMRRRGGPAAPDACRSPATGDAARRTAEGQT